jgi:hypothetical protein
MEENFLPKYRSTFDGLLCVYRCNRRWENFISYKIEIILDREGRLPLSWRRPHLTFTFTSLNSYLYNYITITILDIIPLSVLCLKQDNSEIGFCLCLQVEPTQLGPIARVSLCLRTVSLLVRTEYVPPEDGDRLQPLKRCVLNKRQNDG